MTTQIVSIAIPITRAGSLHHFEMRIPSSTKKIIGVECGMRLQSEIGLVPRVDATYTIPQVEEIGELRLHCADEYQWFYACSLSDMIHTNEKRNHFTDTRAMQKPFMHHGKHESDTCSVIPNTNRIKGFFKDVVGAKHNVNLAYQITISIHLETN
jgi:hypothetical protein